MTAKGNKRMETNWQRTANLIAISLAANRYKLLGELTENVLHFKNTNVQSYKSFLNGTDLSNSSKVSKTIRGF